MKKKADMIYIQKRKFIKIGLIMSFIYSIICSYFMAYMIIDCGFGEGKVSIHTFAWILLPILFVFLGTFILGTIIVADSKSTKK